MEVYDLCACNLLKDPEGLAALEEWFTIEDSEIVHTWMKLICKKEKFVRMDQTEMEQQHCEDVFEGDPPIAESNKDDEEAEESIQLNRKDILNCTDLDESLMMVKRLLHLSSSLQEDDTADLLTRFIINALDWRKKNLH